MELGMIGMGRMGAGMARRLIERGHRLVVHDRDREVAARMQEYGAEVAESLEGLVAALAPPRRVWLMVPAGKAVAATMEGLRHCLTAGDVIVDGGNSHFRRTMERGEALADAGIHLVDAGTSGGIWGHDEGYSLMVGGDEAAVEGLRPIFESLAPGPQRGWGHVGPTGAGHFVKMVHNGIEYGMMQAYAEGFSVLHHSRSFDLDLHRIAEIWRHGSVVRSWLLDLGARALAEDQNLGDVAPYVEDSGEGRWTVIEALDQDVPTPVMTLALLERLRSRDEEGYADRFLASLRHQFGGHAIHKGGKP